MPWLLIGECPFLVFLFFIKSFLAKDDIKIVLIFTDHFLMVLEKFHNCWILKLLGVVSWHFIAVLPLFDFSFNFPEDVVLPLEQHRHFFIEIKLPFLLGHPSGEVGRLQLDNPSVYRQQILWFVPHTECNFLKIVVDIIHSLKLSVKPEGIKNMSIFEPFNSKKNLIQVSFYLWSNDLHRM